MIYSGLPLNICDFYFKKLTLLTLNQFFSSIKKFSFKIPVISEAKSKIFSTDKKNRLI